MGLNAQIRVIAALSSPVQAVSAFKSRLYLIKVDIVMREVKNRSSVRDNQNLGRMMFNLKHFRNFI